MFAGLVAVFVMVATGDGVTKVLMAPLTIHESIQPADVIIVLGSGTKKNGDHLPGQARDRVLRGIQLIQSGSAPMMILSGGLDTQTKLVESEQMLHYAEAQGADPGTIVTETRSRDTYENAKFSLAIMAQHGWQSALVVTSPYHTRRACYLFHQLNGNVRCVIAPFWLASPPTVTGRLENFVTVVREYGAWVFDGLKGYL
ncbi:MAG: YdcF family protein [Candidatus Kerfeldbacteria bacterium]|nr:YdcF family protein [Candidatus Kerfeldbacteria bacterium]